MPNTISGDNEEIDAYILGVFAPITEYCGIVIGIIKRHNDIEDKLIVSDTMDRYSKEQISALVEFQEKYFSIEIILN